MRRNLLADTVSAEDIGIVIDQNQPQLEIQAARVELGRFLVLTTAPQTPGQIYSLVLRGEIHDLTGRNIVFSDQPSEDFVGYRPPARLLINELNANVRSGCDLIEFRVTQGGLLRHTVKERTTVVHSFPEMMVQTDDIVVLHFNQDSTTCLQNVEVDASPGNETRSKTEFANAQFAANYNEAWDHWTTDRGLTATDNVITLWLDDAIVDAVLVSDAPTGTAAAGSETAARYVVEAAQWTTEGGGVPEGGFVDGDFNAHAAQDLNGTGTWANRQSIRRTGDTDRNHKGDWTFGESSFGRAN